MSVTANAGSTATIRVSGLTATKYRIVDADDGVTVILGPITTGITNTGTLRYKATAAVPGVAGVYEIQWDDGSNAWIFTEDLTVVLPDTDIAPTLVDLARKFPSATVVGAYPVTAGPPNGEGPPIGSPTATGTVNSGGIVSFSDLKRGIDYFIGAQVSGTWTWVRYHA